MITMSKKSSRSRKRSALALVLLAVSLLQVISSLPTSEADRHRWQSGEFAPVKFGQPRLRNSFPARQPFRDHNRLEADRFENIRRPYDGRKLISQQALELLWPRVNSSAGQDRPQTSWMLSAGKRAGATEGFNPGLKSHPLAYMISPLSYQPIEIGQLLADRANLGAAELQMLARSPFYRLPDDLADTSRSESFAQRLGTSSECRTISSHVELTKDELDASTGQPVRTCRGLVNVNRCEGACSSSAIPSVRSPAGLIKECSCCNEGTFRRIQVRLKDCFSASTGEKLVGADSPAGESSGSFMDVSVDEPVECECRACDNAI